MLNPLRHRTEMVFSVLLDRRGALAWEEHSEICEAIAEGEAARARELVEHHILSALEHYEKGSEAVDASTEAR